VTQRYWIQSLAAKLV